MTTSTKAMTPKEAKDFFVKWTSELSNLYESSTAASPVPIEKLNWGQIHLNDPDVPAKKFYSQLSSVTKKNNGISPNGGYLLLSDSAIDNGFDVKRLSYSFFKNFSIDDQYSGDISNLFSEISGNKKVYSKLKWDTIPFQTISKQQASTVDWGLINFKKGNLSMLDLSKVDWKEVKGKGKKVFEKSFAKLDAPTKENLLDGLDNKTLKKFGRAISTKALFEKKDFKKLGKKTLDLEIGGDDFQLLGHALGKATANAFVKMQGFKLAEMNIYGDEVTGIASGILKLAPDYEELKNDNGKFSESDAVDLYTDNKEIFDDLASRLGLTTKNLSFIDPALKIADSLSASNLESTKGTNTDDYMIWVENSNQSPSQILLNLNTQKEIDPSTEPGEYFVLYKV